MERMEIFTTSNKHRSTKPSDKSRATRKRWKPKTSPRKKASLSMSRTWNPTRKRAWKKTWKISSILVTDSGEELKAIAMKVTKMMTKMTTKTTTTTMKQAKMATAKATRRQTKSQRRRRRNLLERALELKSNTKKRTIWRRNQCKRLEWLGNSVNDFCTIKITCRIISSITNNSIWSQVVSWIGIISVKMSHGSNEIRLILSCHKFRWKPYDDSNPTTRTRTTASTS
mmetsp:Transcript_9316/g.27824  ORF Transcript_9316/g.27824 Transcript_9316/m.27824 type:complete len:227 (-) Transcript_9316:23-703(-)